MDRRIKISDSGQIFVPTLVSMRDFEIADLFVVTIPTIRAKIKLIFNSRPRTVSGDCIAYKNNIVPESFDLETIIAIAFCLNNSHKAGVFRKWLMRRATQTAPNLNSVFIRLESEYLS